MLWRALKHVQHGFYIDIGAQDPIIDSVSLAFYEHGWRGVHIEPTQQYSARLRRARPDETVEQIAVGDSSGSITFYEFADTGLSTADAGIALRHQNMGFSALKTEVAVVTLGDILDKYHSQPIHWLKIDVEGLEESVLRSWGTCSVRPWILVIESTKPLTQDQTYMNWEEMVLAKGYHFAYFDGLNRFYIHEAHNELLSSFSTPPNIFDDFALSGSASQPFTRIISANTQRAEILAQQAKTMLRQTEGMLLQAQARMREAEERAHRAEQGLNTLFRSRSWRLTAPLRWVGLQVRKIREQGLKARGAALLRRLAGAVWHRIISSINRRPKLRKSLIILAKFFVSEERLRQVNKRANALLRQPEAAPLVVDQLTSRARKIYHDLKAAIRSRGAQD